MLYFITGSSSERVDMRLPVLPCMATTHVSYVGELGWGDEEKFGLRGVKMDASIKQLVDGEAVECYGAEVEMF